MIELSNNVIPQTFHILIECYRNLKDISEIFNSGESVVYTFSFQPISLKVVVICYLPVVCTCR